MASIKLSTLSLEQVTPELIRETVDKTIEFLSPCSSKLDREYLAKKLEEHFDITMAPGTVFEANDYRPWLTDRRNEIDWYFWNRYKRYLKKRRFPPRVLSSMDSVTDQILDHLENPEKGESWKRRGMVVGHVQSGKTANYTGLICKAADAGYKVIVVMAGLLNSLRNQTQARIDEGFIGIDPACKLDGSNSADRYVGVGLLPAHEGKRQPVSLTTRVADFRKNTARALSLNFQQLKEAAIFVVKKNSSTLRALSSWIEVNNENLQDHPMLLIDDEADHASINTKKSIEEATAINQRIRELLKLFDRSSYVGYTATPFANIFIDPDAESDLGQDLFPRDFIVSLDPPTNYIGPPTIFGQNSDLDVLREVVDHDDLLPVRHKIDHTPEGLPESLEDAVRTFILARAIRNLRDQRTAHMSMMVNVSRFTRVQSEVKLLIAEYLRELQQGIRNYSKLPDHQASKQTCIQNMKLTWDKEYSSAGFSWPQVKHELETAASSIDVIEVNSSSSAEPLDYSRHNYPDGRTLIAVGGLSLSRGLTLEGLTVSYFLRNSIMYDTLMQMGRWFGYRDGYEDLCRIHMTPQAASWYQHISEVVAELRSEFIRMKRANMTPEDFGLCVRSHPSSLIVTARNKMRTGRRVLRQVSLEGRLVETAIVSASSTVLEHNRKVMERLVTEISKVAAVEHVGHSFLWKSVSHSLIEGFLDSYNNHPASQLTQHKPILDYVQQVFGDEATWDVLLVGIRPQLGGRSLEFGPVTVNMQSRSLNIFGDPKSASGNKLTIGFPRHRLASRGQEKAGIPSVLIAEAEAGYEKSNIPDKIYRPYRERPLLMLHLINCKEVKERNDLEFHEPIPGWGISFPGSPGSSKPKHCVEYVVNSIWWDQEYKDYLEEDDEITDD